MFKRKILIVEDEPMLANALDKELRRHKYLTIIAHDGEEGLKKALNEKPDLILLDIVMPKMDGLTMLQKLRFDDWGAKAKVMMLTNLDDSAKVAQSLEHGSYDYLIKSNWSIHEVIEKIKEKIG